MERPTPSRTKLEARESASTNLWPRMAMRIAALLARLCDCMPSARPAMKEWTLKSSASTREKVCAAAPTAACVCSTPR